MSAFWGYPHRPMITHAIDSNQIQVKKDKLKVINLTHLPKLQIVEFCKTFYMQYTFWSCLMYKYKLGLACIVKDTERTRFHPQMDRCTNEQSETCIPPSTSWSAGYN